MEDPSRQLGSDEYPRALREIAQPPVALHVRGSWPPEGTKYLAVVGSRDLSEYGREACETLIAGLAGYPVSIVSGLALGADACAHESALRAGLHTIAVLGSGVDNASVYPRTNLGLAKDILAKGGMLVSENGDGYKPQAFDFPKRNRIVVGLSHAVLIVEAAAQSGTLITARLTHEYNRDLLCIPHRINDPHSFGANLFLRLGAALVAEPAHILEALGIEPRAE
jgi:DNA processing protein